MSLGLSLSTLASSLNIQIECPPAGEEEALGILCSTPSWFWQSPDRYILRFRSYERSEARNLAESLWRGDDPLKFHPKKMNFVLGGLEARPSRLAFFAVLDSLALYSWVGASSELRIAWSSAVRNLANVDGAFADALSPEAQSIRLWTVAWRFTGHREYEWMEHQLSTVSPHIRENARTMLLELIPELSMNNLLWEATRFGLRQDAQALHRRLLEEMQHVGALPQRVVSRRRERQRKLGEVFARFSDQCAKCALGGGSCCSRDIPHYYFSELDLGFLKGCDVPLPDFDVSCASNNSCIYISTDGCRFPAEHRPAVCISHTCDAIYDSLTQKEKSLLTRFELRRLMSVKAKSSND